LLLSDLYTKKKNTLFFVILAIAVFSFNVSAQVSANFSASPKTGCAPLIVSFTDLSTGGPTSYTWNLGNSATSFTNNPSATYTLAGVYSVTLTVNNGGTPSTIVKPNYIVVYDKPLVNFHASTYTACVGQTITFTDSTVISSGAPPIKSWAWDFADGNSQNTTTTSVSHIYTSPGTYPVSVITADSNSCTNSKVKTITIIAPPSASFTASPLFACTAPLSVTFTNTSTSSGTTTYLWNFGNGNTSAAQNPSTTYTAAGSYNVSLIVSEGGCNNVVVVPNQIVIQNINVNFTPTPSVVCAGQPVTFSNLSVPTATAAAWNFGDGNNSAAISPAHTYTTAGTYTVSLAATDGNSCVGAATGTVTVNSAPTASFTASPLTSCAAPLVVTFTNTSISGATYNWSFGDGNTSILTNPTNTYTATGSYNVTFHVTNASGTCTDSLVKNAYIVISPPLASFTVSPDSGCAPLLVTFASTSTSPADPIISYTWNYGDGNSAVTATPATSNSYTAAGIYSPTLTVQTASGCTNTFVCNGCVKAGIHPVPNFSFSPSPVCYGKKVTFTDLSTNATGWHYMFGDGGSSLLPNPIYIYADTGTFQIKLYVFNNGCEDSTTFQIEKVFPPKAIMSYSLSCTNYFVVNFASQSEGADSLVWHFGDGTVDTTINNTTTTHTYTTRGPKTVTLTAYNYTTTCSDSITATITIAQPIASYTLPSNQGCYAFSPIFTSTSQDANLFSWNFGDLTTFADTSSLNNPSYTYNLPGRDSVSLVITDVNGCKDSIKGIIKALGPIPYFHADTLGGCRPLPVTFADSTRSDSTLVQWTWDFGDGTPIVTTRNDSITHIYTIPGIYNVTMTVKDTNGCMKSATYASYIQPTFPYPAFTLDTFACKGDLLTFDAGTTNAAGPQYTWDFGDGTVLPNAGAVVTHAYAADNYYSVSLTVTDVNGCDSTIIKKVRILKPTANFDYSILNAGCGTLQVAFQDSSKGYVTGWQWDFGDGASAVASSTPNHTYLQPGSYNVTLTATNLGGCTDVITQSGIIVVPGPVGTFSFSPVTGCSPLTVTFNGSSINAQNYIWDFGDGSVVPGGTTIVHTYNTQGVFNPILSLGDTLPNGSQCLLPAANLTGSVLVTSVINVSVTPHIISLPEDSIGLVLTSAFGGVAPYSYSWTPSSNINCFDCPVVQVKGTGDTLMYTYTVYDQTGCASSDYLLVCSQPCIEKTKIPNVFSPNGDLKNDVFYIPGVCAHEVFSLDIFDRWGSLLFNSALRNHGWDGKTNHGQEAPDGTYFYIVKVKDTTYKGFLQLVR
jgi:gliding motility-associated-like protein